MYDHNSLTFLPHRTNVPLLINHDAERPIGVVRELMRFEDTDGPWLVAVATVTDRPEWLKRGTRASFGCKLARYSSFERHDVMRKGYVTEVSVLTVGHEPLEPGARVLTLRENANPILPEPTPTSAGVPPPVASAGAVPGVFYGGGLGAGGHGRAAPPPESTTRPQ